MRILSEKDTLERIEKQLTLKSEFVGETDGYSKEVNRLIRERYSLSDEIAILRKALAKLEIEFAELEEYNEFVENCKEMAKEEISAAAHTELERTD